MQLTTSDLRLNFSIETGLLNLESQVFPCTSLNSNFNLTYSVNDQDLNQFAPPLSIKHIGGPQRIETQFGLVKTTCFLVQSHPKVLSLILWLGLSIDHSLACIRFEITNQSNDPITLNRITFLDILPGDLHLGTTSNPDPAFYSNGWQSWSCSGAYGSGEKQTTSILGPFQNPMVINPGTPLPREKNHFTGDMFGVLGERTSRIGLLAGCLSQKIHYSSLEAWVKPGPTLKMWANGDKAILPAKQSFQSDWAVISFVDLNTLEPLSEYYHAVARVHTIQSKEPVPVGWCSWYHFYNAITEQVIKTNLDSIVQLKQDLPLPLLQIDDGFETHPGDWFDFDPSFPHGLQPLASKTKAAGLTPGLWLAPFIVHPKANLVREHPNWLLRNKRGNPVNAGFVWNTFTYALDLTNPEALAYTCQVVRKAVQDWGFEYLKLDFLYAAALDGVYQDPTQSRAQVLRQGLEALREAVGPGVTMLACGCPLGSALGLFEAMRISADVSGHWKPHFPPVSLFLQQEPHMPAARNALQNILTRAPIHRYWWINDPDCLLIRPDTDLTLAEVHTLATAIGLTGGSLLLSDDLPTLSKDRLQIAQALLPVIDQRAYVIDWFDKTTPSRLRVDLEGTLDTWHLLAIFNWENQPVSLDFSPQDFRLPKAGFWWLREFWTGAIGQMGAQSPYTFHGVPPHGVRVIAVRPYNAHRPAYIGGDLHLSQGLEISAWRETEHALSLRFKLSRKASGRAFFYLPWHPASALFKSQPQIFHQDEPPGIYSLELDDIDGGELQIRG